MQWFKGVPKVIDGHWRCPDDSCDGEMVCNGVAWYSDPLGHHHFCTICGSGLATTEVYPVVEAEVLISGAQ